MTEAEWPEADWTAAHEEQLIGQSVEDASAIVHAAGFMPSVVEADSGVTIAAAYFHGSILMWARDGRITGFGRAGRRGKRGLRSLEPYRCGPLPRPIG